MGNINKKHLESSKSQQIHQNNQVKGSSPDTQIVKKTNPLADQVTKEQYFMSNSQSGSEDEVGIIYSQTQKQNHNEGQYQKQEGIAKQSPLQIETLNLPKTTKQISISSKRQDPSTYRSYVSQQIVLDRQKSIKILKELIVESIPISEVKHVKIQDRKRVMIAWLKEGAETEKQKERDAHLIQRGYQIYTDHSIANIKQRYEQSNSRSLAMTTIVLFSYSSYYNNEETLKQMHDYFIKQGKIAKIFVIKPPEQGNYQYQMHLSELKSSKAIVEISYPIVQIKQKLAQLEATDNINSINISPLTIWEDVKGLNELYQSLSPLEVFSAKCKVSLSYCLRVGWTLIDQLEEKKYFKTMLKNYASFHDLFLIDSPLLKQLSKNQSYLKRIGLRMLEDPINFYLNPTHEVAINRVLRQCGDVPQCLNNIILPLNLLFYKIKEQYQKQTVSKRYKNQFVCFYQMRLTSQQLQYLQNDSIFENLGFIKANLKQHDTKKNQFENPANTLFLINVLPTSRDEQTDNGYCFIGETPKDVCQEETQKQKQYFSGFTYILFNLLNTFLIKNHHYDGHLKKHVIELQFGYISSQIYKRNIVNFISKEQVAPRYIQKQQECQVNYQAIIKYQSNKKLLDKIEDVGDCLSLLGRYNDAISYYDAVFAKCKTEISDDVLLLSNFQNKKGINYELGKSSQNALQYFYNAYNFIRKTKKYSQIQLNVIKCLEKSQEFQKMATFSETLVEIANKYNFMHQLQKQFLLELYGLIAKAHIMKNITNFNLNNCSPQIMRNYERGMQVIQQFGEFNKQVPDFYYGLGYYYLTIGKPFDALIYLNKALIIKMTILTQSHPQLCPLYQILTVAYVGMHDYKKALNSINSAYFIYSKYYSKSNYRFLAVYEIRGKIFALMNKIEQAMQSFQAEKNIIDGYVEKKKFSTPLQRKYCIKNTHIGLFNLVQQKQLTPYYDSTFRKDKSEIFKVNILIYQGKLLKLQNNSKKANEVLTNALNLNKQELGEAHILNLEIMFIIANVHIQSLSWKQAQLILKQSLALLAKLRRENEEPAIRYYKLTAKFHERRRQYNICLKNLNKMKEIYFRIYGKQSLQNCRVSSKIGKIHLMMKNLQQAKPYIVEHDVSLGSMLLKVKNDHQIKLFGSDLNNYVKQIQIEMGLAIQNKGMLLQGGGSVDEAILKYKEAIERLKEIIGENHPKVAKIIYRLGACYLKKGNGECDRSLQELKKALSIFKCGDIYNLIQRVPIHISLAEAYEAKNQLPSAVQELGQAMALLKTIHQVGIQFLEIVKQVRRLVDVIISHPTISYLKSIYFIIAKIFSEERDRNGQLRVLVQSQYQHQIQGEIQYLLAKEQEIRAQIEDIENKEQRQEKELMKRLEQKGHYITLQKIKENFQIRKHLRDKVAK